MTTENEAGFDSPEAAEEEEDVFEAAGVVSAGLKVAPPEQGSDDAVRMYLRSIGRVDLLTADEEVSLAKRIERGDMTAKQQMVEANLRLEIGRASCRERV